MSRTRVLLLFGGRSAEHEVSVVSARSVYAAIDSYRYDVVLAGIDQQGRWYFGGKNSESLLSTSTVVPDEQLPARLSTAGTNLVSENGDDLPDSEFEVVFPLLHGPYGEDGTIQGLLELAGLAYVGAGVSASAVGMDKVLARAIFAASGLPQTQYSVIMRSEWRREQAPVLERLEEEHDYPLFVKPANLGSSVGISKVHDRQGLHAALELASRFDTKLIIERSVENARELECAILGNDYPKASGVGEIIPGGEFYDYTTKYIDERSQLVIPAVLEKSESEAVQELAIRAFKAIDCSGLARVDCFMCSDGSVLVNEINTMPGFTPISMYPKLWAAAGIDYGDLIDRLIQLGLERHFDRADLQSTLN
uniref:D-alanine--D-alanine ligase n=1 Tax=uncultured actinobacterium HF0200_46I24 TaxID=723602 RepID=E7C4B9_9ACTN|nr:D-alanine-D-alanine ligase and related ATP-grasp enzymes [uncultured actinobacterium HF0200_46I24]